MEVIIHGYGSEPWALLDNSEFVLMDFLSHLIRWSLLYLAMWLTKELSLGVKVSALLFLIYLCLYYYYFSSEVSLEESFKSTLSIFGGHIEVDKTENIICKFTQVSIQKCNALQYTERRRIN